MPALPATDPDDPIIALLTADWHLSHLRPLARADEDWYGAMRRTFRQLEAMLPNWGVPILVAGDLLHSYNQPPELVNFLLEHMPNVIAIPGNHDLPNHNYEDLHKSAFWTLVQAKKVQLLKPDFPERISQDGNLVVHGFASGHPAKPKPKANTDWTGGDMGMIHLALIHEFCWIPDHTYPNAPSKQRLGSHAFGERIAGYSAVAIGDNHSGFLVKLRGQQVLNCGALIPRRSDERDMKPAVGLLHRSGKISRAFLGTESDRWEERIPEMAEAMGKTLTDTDDLLEELAGLGDNTLDFIQAVRFFLDKHQVRGSVAKWIIKALDRSKTF